MKKSILIVFLVTKIIFGQTTYYISNSVGNDNNNGKSESNPWKTISKVNSVNLTPGDKVLFKSGDIWIKQSLKIKNSGSQNQPIVISSFGSGAKPIINLVSSFPSKWSDPNTWTELSTHPNVWQADLWNPTTLRKAVRRVWLDGTEYNYTPNLDQDNYDGTYGVSATHRHSCSYSIGKEYIYAPSNPATYYSSMQYSGYVDDDDMYRYAIELKNVDYIRLENFDLRGGLDCALRIDNSDYIVIDGCDIGYGSQEYGIRIDNGSDYGIVKNSNFDSGFRIIRILDSAIAGQVASRGVGLENGASHWEIYNNYFFDWNFTGVASIAWTSYSNYHSIHDNEMTAPDLGYSKGVQIQGLSPYHKTHVEIYNNYIHDMQAAGFQINGWYVNIHHNIIENITKSQNMHNNYANGRGVMAAKADGNISPDYIYFFNNTMKNVYGNGVQDFTDNIYFMNNLFLNVASQVGIQIYSPNTNDREFKNNITYGSNVTSSSLSFYFGSVLNITDFNSADVGTTSTIDGNTVYEGVLGNLMNTDFTLPTGSPALNAGVDISNQVPDGFKDRLGNLVNRQNPNIGAIAAVNGSISNDGDNLGSSDKSIQILSPNGGENWNAGSTQEIKWVSSESITNVHLFYSVNNGSTWEQITAQENTGLFNWEIPNINSEQCLVRVKDADNFSIVDKSNSQFKISTKSEENQNASYLKVFLEASYSNELMNNILSASKLLPLQQPYNQSPWIFQDSSVLPNFDNKYVDWVLIELRKDIMEVTYQKVGILTSNGVILNTDGSYFDFNEIIAGKYYIVIKHRNHLSIMSNRKIDVKSGALIKYDFTKSISSAYGKNALIELGTGDFGMIAGDADANGIINNLDFGKVANNILIKGYSQGDLDMNGIINVLDYSFINKNIFRKSNVPNK